MLHRRVRSRRRTESENRDVRQLLWHRHWLVQMRTRVMNQLQALAINECQRWKSCTKNQSQSIIRNNEQASYSGSVETSQASDVLSLPKTSQENRPSRFPIVNGKTSYCPHASAFVVDSKGASDLPISMEISWASWAPIPPSPPSFRLCFHALTASLLNLYMFCPCHFQGCIVRPRVPYVCF